MVSAEDVKNWIRRIEDGERICVIPCRVAGLQERRYDPLTMGSALHLFHHLRDGFSYSIFYKSHVSKKDYAVFISAPDAPMGEWRGESTTAECAMMIASLKAYLAIKFKEAYMKDSLI